jgi:predicted nucleic acid-binding protein
MGPFFDTNVLVYSVDEDEPDKNAVAQALVEEHLIRGEGMLSVQVLREFYSSARRLRRPLSDERAREMVRYFAAFVPMPEDRRLVLDAVRRSQEASLSFWDALIVEAALAAGADRLLTEDLQHGQTIGGMRVENPFL